MNNVEVFGKLFMPEIRLTNSMYEATFPGKVPGTVWHISQDGRVWKTK
jgi:hypothetical protein